MKTTKLFVAASITGVVLAGGLVAPAYAWHPEVKITKYVQNQTAGGQMKDANEVADAVSTKPGDVIKYTLVVENPAGANAQNHNDLHFTKLVDKLPAGVELVSDAAKREIKEDLGVLKAGQKVTKEYILKVTSTKDGDVITNEACVSGDSEVKDAPRADCDPAVIKVSVPTPPKTPEPPKEMPVTGPEGVAATAGTVTVLGYLGNLLRLKRRNG